MIEWEDEGIVLSVRRHGENGGIISLLTPGHGRASGYVYGATSTKMRGVLEPGNIVNANWRAKSESQLGSFSLELARSHAAAVMGDPVKLTALQSACTLIDKTLPENENQPGIYAGTKALMEAFHTDIWAPTYVYWELGLLKALGFGLDLSVCAATGETENLVYVSPKSGCAVSRDAGFVYKEKMLSLPGFLRGEDSFVEDDILEGLKLTGHFFLHRVFAAQTNTNLPEPRLRLEEKFLDKAA